MNQSRHILQNYRVHFQRRYFNLLTLLRPANLSTRLITIRKPFFSAHFNFRRKQNTHRKRSEKSAARWTEGDEERRLYGTTKGRTQIYSWTESKKKMLFLARRARRGKSHLSATFLSYPPSSPPSYRPVHSSRLRETLVEQIGTNDRRKAVKAEFIYAFLP